MFDIGWTELLLLAVLILLVMGPRELPIMLRTLGRYVGNFRTMAFNFRRQLDIMHLDENDPPHHHDDKPEN
ncbi:MAG: twin-arginine translocase subunit TatB [Alphaproteobacteria bacterium]|nr:twin-arginine translocase subunit TatB [Alphaproteobacteria bacterium]